MSTRWLLAGVLVSALFLGCPDSNGPRADGGLDAASSDTSVTDAPRNDAATSGDALAIPDGFATPDALPMPDAFAIPDGGDPRACWASDAHQVLCPPAPCDGPSSFAWDGVFCLEIPCGACRGSECASLPHTLAECERAHAGCEPQQCADTGGRWLWWVNECSHRRCGVPGPIDCPFPHQVCDCGPDREFGPGTGCRPATCPVVEPVDAPALCATTGGTWAAGACCHARCGAPCPTTCAEDACVCGPRQIFDPALGCVDAEECLRPGAGEPCDTSIGDWGARRVCADGVFCCLRSCGPDGCTTDPVCRAPICSDTVDACGNPR